MSTRFWGSLGAIALIIVSTTAGAFEPPTGSRLGERLKPIANTSANMTRISARLAECIAAKYPSQARAFLDATDMQTQKAAERPLNRSQLCDFRSFVDYNVEAINIRTERKIYRGLLAEGLLKDARRDKGLAAMPLQAKYDRPWFAMTGREAMIDEMAVCISAINPGGVRRIFNTLHDSTEERAALAELAPSFGTCLESGVQLTANSLSLRTALAEALYHRAYDVAPAEGEAIP